MNRTAFSLLAVLIPSLTSVAGTTRYVNLNNPIPAAPYTTWATAATSIQDAIDAAIAGDQILVTNGVYQAGSRAVYGSTNRVAVTKPLTVQSVNGPAVTVIRGQKAPGGGNGTGAMRCVYLTNGAVLAGFTLTNGATQPGDIYKQLSGGGVWCESASTVVSNCILAGNSADYYGGSAYYGTLNNCTLSGNWATKDGGGAYYGTLNNCMLSSNSASYGGGAYSGTLSNCTLTGNWATNSGGGAY